MDLMDFLNQLECLTFHMVDGSSVCVKTKDIMKADCSDNNYYIFYLNTGKIMAIWDNNITWMEADIKKDEVKE